MAQEPSEIKDYIESEREKLGDGLEEIENRMKDAFDLRVWYKKNTPLVLGAAVAGGFLLSALVGRSPSSGSVESSAQPNTPKKSSQISRVGDVLDNTVAALLGMAAHKLQDFVSQTIPGFNEQYSEAERKRLGQTERQEV